ncbi:Nicotinate dehydrogenase subunit B [BD1-7 clade bacterium]|uniref:Nicotinate dehydrogenase subunit B n=1 Tax=BD1-7 clade bacterium TaxID=2029982 RepID=A0A5S9QXP0_9GAMM|nr:Nicotinate dehydrogenase subunit B [BD1-7 clade bacterium]
MTTIQGIVAHTHHRVAKHLVELLHHTSWCVSLQTRKPIRAHANRLIQRKNRLCWLSLLFVLMPVQLQASEEEAFNAQNLAIELINRYPEYPVVRGLTAEKTAQIKRGEYIAQLGDCIACHTAKESNAIPFSGGLPIPTPFGTFYTPNITPDKQTGIGQWRFEEFRDAMRYGIDVHGRNYFPAFPYVYFTQVSNDDLRDLWAYLQVIPQVSRLDQGDTLPFPINVRLFQSVWKKLYFRSMVGGYQYDDNQSERWNRGRYIVEGLGHCAMCHSPLNVLGAEKAKYHLTGAFVEGYWAPDITRRGLGKIPHFEVADVFIEGKLINNAGDVRGPMEEANHDSLRYLTKDDQDAIVDYLMSVVSDDPRPVGHYKASQNTLASGHQVFENVCSICHVNGETGAPKIGDEATWEYRLTNKGLNALYRHVIDGYNNMPARGACESCTDQQIRNAVDYVLYHSFGPSYWEEFKHPTKRSRPQRTSVAVGKTAYEDHCASCHDSGKDDAPKIGDIDAWKPILEKNMEVLISHTMHGYKSMPANGGCETCTKSEIIAAVKYLVQNSQEGKDFDLW